MSQHLKPGIRCESELQHLCPGLQRPLGLQATSALIIAPEQCKPLWRREHGGHTETRFAARHPQNTGGLQLLQPAEAQISAVMRKSLSSSTIHMWSQRSNPVNQKTQSVNTGVRGHAVIGQ
ncbi:hypothetical protein EYF80_018153 [Liparis tanakae]|uniref:Uncharacterized protein n=1 Tax=Liparis tanakae TaxID=230148 RepID=A0A4Z2I146_9TELE|nr:hypothetical protein EYF80_018153 [Liparis tanakae]